MIFIRLVVCFHQIFQPVQITLHLIEALNFLAGPESVNLNVALCDRLEGGTELVLQLVDIYGSFATDFVLGDACLDYAVNKSRLIGQLEAKQFHLRLQLDNRILVKDIANG